MKVHENKLFIFSLIILSIVLQISSCNDPVFYMVHEDTKILDPKIGGSPANFVVVNNNKMYTASGKKIFIYSDNDWSEWKKLEGFVTQLAATDNSLYALYLNGSNGKIRRFSNDDTSSEVNIPGNVQSIYSCENILFVGVRDNSTYKIYYFDEENPPAFDDPPEITYPDQDGVYQNYYISVLNGAASDNGYYYLCTYSGIFCVSKSSHGYALPDLLERDAGFTGIINLNENKAAAISINGKLYEINNAVITSLENTGFGDYKTTGALALFFNDKDDTAPSLLLVGRKENTYYALSGYSNGYVEIELDSSGGIKTDAVFSEPGKNALSSVDNYERYASSLGKKPVNHIIQTPSGIDDKMTLFASTQQNGVWSYKDRGEGKQWNAEE